MADSAALLVDEILPHQPMRQWVLSVPFPLRFLFASQPAVIGQVLGIVYRTIATHLTHKAGYTKATAQAGAVTLIQHFGGALNANIHFHTLFLDGIYVDGVNGSPARFRWVKAPTSDELIQRLIPLDFISRLAALVPKPRVNLTRFHGVFAPNSKYRMQIPDIH